jgi:hypothetical protein
MEKTSAFGTDIDNVDDKLSSGYKEFWKTANENYPEQMKAGGLLDQGMYDSVMKVVFGTPPDRFIKPTLRNWSSSIYPWSFPIARKEIVGALALTYKGLVHIRTPFDLALYPRLIWELQPRTILELGSFQGGSGLWLADQMSVLCSTPGRVHSFDLHGKCISRRANHQLLTFHEVDLSKTTEIDRTLFSDMAHPWLVIDDAHVDVFKVFAFLNEFMEIMDCYVIEDIPLRANSYVMQGLQLCEEAGFLVDTYYTDAFGANLTCAPNAWLRKF